VYKNGQQAGQVTFFQNIPITFWWTIVTLTTVGYGDTYPNTNWGRLVGALTMITAIIMVAFPVTIIGQAFGAAAEEYRIQKRKERLKREQRIKDREAKQQEAAAMLAMPHENSMVDPVTGVGLIAVCRAPVVQHAE
jgi:membrane protein insertase Oxa1/YidC/SpoIIIJ